MALADLASAARYSANQLISGWNIPTSTSRALAPKSRYDDAQQQEIPCSIPLKIAQIADYLRRHGA